MRKNCNLRIKLFFIIFSLSLIFVIDTYSQQYWHVISKPTNRNLSKCSFIDTSNGWIAGDSGTILYTSNGGYNWVAQTLPLRDNIYSVFFLNKRLGWAIAHVAKTNFYGTYLLKTTNGGINWDSTQYPVDNCYIRTIFFIDSLIGYIGGNIGQLCKSTNGGINWVKCIIDTTVPASNFPINKFKFLSNRTGLACGGVMDIAGVMWKTTNYGQFWTPAVVAPEPIDDIKIFDSLNYLAIGGDYEFGASILRTSNGGLNWSYKTIEFFGVPQALSFRTDTEGWVPMGTQIYFVMTSDAGLSWSVFVTPDSTNIFDLTFLNDRFGIGVGLNGAVVRYVPVPVYSVSGVVKYNDNNQPLTSGIVKAFKLNKSTGNIIVVDSALVQSNGSYSMNNVPPDSVNIGAFTNSTLPNDWVITYYPSAIYWQNATVLYPSSNLTNIDISAIRLVSVNANNSVSGKVMEHSKGNIKDVFLYAKNGNTFVKCVVTDENGVYDMQSLPSGNLKILVNRLGYSSDSTNVTVTETSNIDSVNFYLYKMYVGIKQIGSSIPSDYKLFQNYPNPFNPSTVIKFQIKDLRLVTLKVYDLLGREIVTLVNEKLQAGTYEIPFFINRYSNNLLPSGIYFYRLQSGDFIETKRMAMIK
jgi:photosystem II stability/assembly factor-like uncharacterized protein